MTRWMLEESLKTFALSLLIFVWGALLFGQTGSGGIGPGDSQSRTKHARILSKPDPEPAKEVPTEPEATIVLRAIFTADGKVTNVHFVNATPKDIPKETVEIFKERAIKAAKLIKFIPATKDGRPVSMFMQLEYNFNTPEEKPAAKTPDAESSKPKNQKPKV